MGIVTRRLATSSRRLLLDLLASAAEEVTATGRLELLIDGFAALLEGEVGGFNYVDVIQRRALVVMRPRVVADPVGDLQAAYGEHPVVMHYRRNRSSTPVLLSSCALGRWRRWKDHPTYEALFRPMGTPHEIVIPVPSSRISPLSGESYAITRSGSDFGDRELSIALAAQELLRVLHDVDMALSSAGRLDLLTTSERNVLQLYSMGLTEAQIAAHRGSARATVHTQIRIGCAKLELSGRDRHRKLAQVFGYAPPSRLPVDRLARILNS